MDKDVSMHLEEAGSQYATPFVENKELERRCGADRLHGWHYPNKWNAANELFFRILWKVDVRLIPPLFIMVSFFAFGCFVRSPRWTGLMIILC